MQPQVAYEFGPFRLQPNERLLLRDGAPVAVTPKVFDLLAAFVRDRGRALPKDQLLQTVWPDTFVEEASLTRTVSLLREALGPAGRDYIETVSKFGYRFTAQVREAAAPDAKSMAVLPFTQLGGGDASYLSIGLADALIAKLAHIRQLVVRPTSAVLTYAGTASTTAARELQVELVLEGTVRTAAERICVTAQLVNASGTIVWSGRFDTAFTDLFSIEDAIAEKIAAALSMQRSFTRPQTTDAEAYRLYLKGRHFWNRRTSESLQKAMDYFNEAIARDPRYGAAYCGLADAHLLLTGDAQRAREAAMKALELDETLGEAHTTLARIEMGFDWNWSAAEERFRRAAELTPEYPTMRQWRAHLFAATGRLDEAIAEIEHARALDPLSVTMHTASAWIHYMARRYRQSIARYREALEIDPGFAHARRQIAMACEQAGRVDEAIAMLSAEAADDHLATSLLAHAHAVAGNEAEARKALERVTPQSEKQSALLQIIAATHLELGDRDAALDFLGRAVDARASTLMWLKVDPWFDALREDRAFRAILTRVGFT